jgi:poly(3-hydroxybutyrate) depolymerase
MKKEAAVETLAEQKVVQNDGTPPPVHATDAVLTMAGTKTPFTPQNQGIASFDPETVLNTVRAKKAAFETQQQTERKEKLARHHNNEDKDFEEVAKDAEKVLVENLHDVDQATAQKAKSRKKMFDLIDKDSAEKKQRDAETEEENEKRLQLRLELYREEMADADAAAAAKSEARQKKNSVKMDTAKAKAARNQHERDQDEARYDKTMANYGEEEERLIRALEHHRKQAKGSTSSSSTARKNLTDQFEDVVVRF